MDLTLNEKRLLQALERHGESTVEQLSEELGATPDAVVQWGYLCMDRGLAEVRKDVKKSYELTEEGREYADKGLPERQLLDSIDMSKVLMKELQKQPLAKIGIGWMRKKGWITIKDGYVEKTGEAPVGKDEILLNNPVDSLTQGIKEIGDLIRRELVLEKEDVDYSIAITGKGLELVRAGLDFRDEVGTLLRDQIISGKWKDLSFRKYSTDKIPKRIHIGKIHPYQRLINEMRQLLMEMGFTEIYGEIVQSSYWNFDTLFQPQDHPAREMQDTFFLDKKIPLPPDYRKIKEMHENGGDTGSTGWGGNWREEKAEECVLRTHTTGLTIKYLSEHADPPVKVFCIGRSYRREAIDPTHTPEFEQLEGIVMDRNVTFSNLLGILKEFYNRMGFEEVRFRPGYFPYTEPSVEPEVYVDGLGWVELGGAGVFRKEVTCPWGIDHPVLAWGLGASRVAMLRMGLKDLRQLYRSDVDWIREMPVFMGKNRGR